jgi:chemotaxis protein MotB
LARSRRETRQAPDIWPGFVDALSSLLLVIIFLLVVFVLGQFFLSQLLEGKDTRLNSLEQVIAGLTQVEHALARHGALVARRRGGDGAGDHLDLAA